MPVNGSPIITENLSNEFKKAVSVDSGRTITAAKNLPDNVKNRVQRAFKGATTHTAASSQSVVEPFFSPFIQRTTVERPKDYKELNKWKRHYYYSEPIVGAACELHSEFPLSTFDVVHEDSGLQKEFQGWMDDLGMYDFLLDMLLEYWVIGEAFPFGFLDNIEDPHTFEKFVLLDPSLVEVKYDPLVGKTGEPVLSLGMSNTINDIVNKGSGDKETGDLYAKIPQDVIDASKSGEKMPLSNLQCYQFKRKADYFSLRGVSIIERCLKTLMYRDKLREAQYVVADRHITPKEFYMIGTEQQKATSAELNNFRDLLAETYNQPNQAIIWHHALKIQWEGANGRILPLQPEFQYIDKQLAIALLINEGIVTAERQPYASTSVALDVMIQRYLSLRMRVEEWLRNFVFKTVCSLNKIVKPYQFEIDHKIRVGRKERNLWLPDVKWNKANLRDDIPKLQFLMQAVDKGFLPAEYLYTPLDYKKEDVLTKLAEEKERKKKETPVEEGLAEVVPGQGTLPFAKKPELPRAMPEVAPESRAVSPRSHKQTELPTGI